MMNTMKRVFRDPVDYSAPVDQQRTPWDVIEDGEGFKLRVDMPGLSKEEVRRFFFSEFLLSCSWISLTTAQVRFTLITIRP